MEPTHVRFPMHLKYYSPGPVTPKVVLVKSGPGTAFGSQKFSAQTTFSYQIWSPQTTFGCRNWSPLAKYSLPLQDDGFLFLSCCTL